jgi:hypothetical protein
LLLRGKHKKEWANEANKNGNNSRPADNLNTPPLLEAITSGNMAAVEWLQTDMPARLLKKWLSDNQDEKLLKIAQNEGGLAQFVDNWLNARSIPLQFCCTFVSDAN